MVEEVTVPNERRRRRRRIEATSLSGSCFGITQRSTPKGQRALWTVNVFTFRELPRPADFLHKRDNTNYVGGPVCLRVCFAQTWVERHQHTDGPEDVHVLERRTLAIG